MNRKQSWLTNLLQLLDGLAMLASPFAILLFLVLVIVVLDGLGQHVQLLRELDQRGVEASGIWPGIEDPQPKFVIVELLDGDSQYNSVALYLRFYRRDTLQALKVGQVVRLRYGLPPGEEYAILLDEVEQVRGYVGYLTDVFWPMLLAWGVIVLHPDFLFIGLGETSKPAAGSAPADQPAQESP